MYSSLKTLALAAIVLIAIDGLVSLISIPSAMMQIDLLDRIQQGAFDDAEVAANDAREGALGLLTMAISIVAAIAFVTWFHRAYKNLDHFGHAREHGTGWAIGAWITPIISLFRPYQIAREIWHASDPDRGHDWTPASNPPLLSTWWGLWILGNVLGQVAFRASLGAESASELHTSTMVQIALDVLNVATVPPAILVVRELTRRQETRAERMANGGQELAAVFE